MNGSNRLRPLRATLLAAALLGSLGGAGLAAACAGAAPREAVLLSGSAGDTLVLVPLNVTFPMPEEVEAGAKPVWDALQRYLRAQGAELKTLSFPAARKLWVESIVQARTDSGATRAGFDDAARLFAQRIAQHAEFDAVIVPGLFVQRAVVDGATASWDGAERTLELRDGLRNVELPPDVALVGAAPAASLHAVVLDASGAKLQDKRAGLVLLVGVRALDGDAVRGPRRFAFHPERDPFADRVGLLRGAANALAPFLPRLSPEEVESRRGARPE